MSTRRNLGHFFIIVCCLFNSYEENLKNLNIILSKIPCTYRDWILCVLSLLGQQKRLTKFSCFIHEWNNEARNQYQSKRQWFVWNTLINDEKNFIKPLKDSYTHTLGVLKQFVKYLPKVGDCFKYFPRIFPQLSEAKLKEGIFIDRNVRKLMLDSKLRSELLVG